MMNLLKRVISYMLVLTLLFTSIGHNVMANNDDNNSKDATYYKECVGYSVEFELTRANEEGYNGQLKLTNTSDTLIDSWALSFKFPYEITNDRLKKEFLK